LSLEIEDEGEFRERVERKLEELEVENSTNIVIPQINTDPNSNQGDVTYTTRFPIQEPIFDHGTIGLVTELVDMTFHIHTMLINGDIGISFGSIPTAGFSQGFVIDITQDAIGGRLVTWPVSVIPTPTVDTAANATTRIHLRTNDQGTVFYVTNASGGDNLGDHTATQDINFATRDGINIDRLRFVTSSGAPVTSGDTSIFKDLSLNLQFNVAPTKDFVFTVNDVDALTMDDTFATFINPNNRYVLELENANTGIIDLDQVGELRFVGDDDAVGATRNTYGRILVNADDVSSGTKDSRMSFFVMVNNASTALIELNRLGNNRVDINTELDLNDNGISQVNFLNPFSNLNHDIGTTVLTFEHIYTESLNMGGLSTEDLITHTGTAMQFINALGNLFQFSIDGDIFVAMEPQVTEQRSFLTSNMAQYNTFQDVTAGVRAIGNLQYNANRTTGGKTTYVQAFATAENISNTNFAGSWNLNIAQSGAEVTYISCNFLQSGEIAFNRDLEMNNNNITGFTLLTGSAGTFTTSMSVLGSAILGDNSADTHAMVGVMDIAERTVPGNPSAGIVRLFNNSVTGQLSVRKSGGTTVSLEGGGGVLDDLSDVTISSPGFPEYLTFTGSIWENKTAQQGLLVTTNTLQTITGNKTFTGASHNINSTNIFIGDSTGDNVFIVARVDSSFIPDNDSTYNMGQVGLEWNDHHIQQIICSERIRSDSSTSEMGFFVRAETGSIGGFGTVQIPIDTGFSSTAAQADSDFGGFRGAIGYYQSSNLVVVRRSDGDWAGASFVTVLV